MNKPNEFEAEARLSLQGKMIQEVRYMTAAEAEKSGWDYRPLIIILNDGNWLVPMSDDEGNNAGAIGTSFPNLYTVPVMR